MNWEAPVFSLPGLPQGAERNEGGNVNENAPTLSLVILWLDHRIHAVAVATGAGVEIDALALRGWALSSAFRHGSSGQARG
ncbi:protein of unknown function [Nitratireductor aquimarinus]